MDVYRFRGPYWKVEGIIKKEKQDGLSRLVPFLGTYSLLF
jgi:hypothetical protein